MGRNQYAFKEDQKAFVKEFMTLCETRNSWKVWRDYLTITAISISNAVDHRDNVREKREQDYMSVIGTYQKSEVDTFCRLFSETMLALDKNPEQDFLGEIYMGLGLGQNQKGQFFTPWHVAEMMGLMSYGERIEECIEKKGYVSVNDPTCGAGVMLLAFASACKKEGLTDISDKVLFVGQDIDLVAVKMCYIQLSLCNCAGYVIWGNSLTQAPTGDVLMPENDEADVWYTPSYYRLLDALVKVHEEKSCGISVETHCR